jgi:glycerol-3-phosphate dehydrogenase
VTRPWASLADKEYDLVVVGGGIFGACVAWDAVLRGVSVLLLERGDFGEATSANAYKFVHGGMRYLQQLDLIRLWESSRERSALLRIAPHLVYPLPIAMPTYGHGMRGKEVLRAGFAAYELLTANRNRGIRDPRRRIPRAEFLSRDEILREFPELPRASLTGGAVFADAQVYSTPRLTLGFVRAAQEAGATVVNYAEVTRFLRRGDRVSGVEVRDVPSDTLFSVRARAVVNAAGPWAAPLLLRGLDLDLGPRRPVFSRDVYFVTPRRLASPLGLAAATVTRDAHAVIDRGARHLFLVPWREFTLVGVWHGVHRGAIDHVQVSPDELERLVAEANQAYRGLDLRVDDIQLVNTGLILFGDEQQESGSHDFGKRSLLIDHARDHGIEGLVTLVGVRSTVARGMADKTSAMVLAKLGRPVPRCRTDTLPITGGDVPDFERLVAEISAWIPDAGAEAGRALAHNHGSRYADVLACAQDDPTLLAPLDGTTVLGAEVVHAVRREMAYTLADVVHRRTDLGTAGRPPDQALQRCAAIAAREAGWDEARTAAELARVESFFHHKGAVRAFGTAEAALA